MGAWIETLSVNTPIYDFMSHPVWVRGLKHIIRTLCLTLQMSHPVWVRGLKRDKTFNSLRDAKVAPRVGAWIETGFISIRFDDKQVAPRVGAWIETSKLLSLIIRTMSHPVWVRGLKLSSVTFLLPLPRRTPCGCVD